MGASFLRPLRLLFDGRQGKCLRISVREAKAGSSRMAGGMRVLMSAGSLTSCFGLPYRS